MLRSHSGETLNVMAQLPMIPGQGNQEIFSVVLIQKHRPQILLIEGDLQPALAIGYSYSMLTVRKSGNQTAVLLQNHTSDMASVNIICLDKQCTYMTSL